MLRKSQFLIPLTCLLWLGVPLEVRADDTDLLNRSTPAPNVLIIFDTSQSMTWYRSTGSTRGDEYIGWTGAGSDNTPMARMAIAKSVLSTVVDTYFTRVRLGLASYDEDGTPANPNATVRIKRYHYYCTKTGTWCTSSSNPNPARQYITFDRASATLTNLQLWVDAANLNMPTQSTFTLQWGLNPGQVPNPVMNTNTSGGGAPYSVCRYSYTQTNYNHAGQVTGNPSGTQDIGSPPCSALPRTLRETETFNFKAAGDDPTPWKYRVIRTWTGGSLYGAGCAGPGGCTTQYATDQGAGWTNYQRVFNSVLSVVITPPPATTSYSWTYYYKGTCTSGCSGYMTHKRNTATQATNAPVKPSPLTIPFTRVYTWSGNNYEMNPPAAEASCPVGAGATVLVDVGGAADKNALKDYLGTGPNRQKELHGANFYTPLATTLDTVRTYFLNPAGVVQQDPQKDCRHNYVILVTDGGESCPLVPSSGPGSPGDKAAALLSAPVNDAGGVPTYVVALDGGSFSPDEQAVLADMAAKGSADGLGTYYSASSPAALLNSLNAIIGSILSQDYKFTNPAVPSVRTSDNLLYIQGGFTTPTSPPADPNAPLWQGSLVAYALDAQGHLQVADQAITQAPLWEAASLLAARLSATRTITTVVNGSQTDFQPVSIPVQNALNVTQDVNGDGFVNAADAVRVIQVVRGNQGAGLNKGFLGDIFHSVPILVGPPSPTFVDRTLNPAQPDQLLSLTVAPDTFAPFRNARKTRQRLVLVGANDGMLHAFNAGTFDAGPGKYNTGDGSELWGFVPPQMLTKLQMLAVNNGHQYYVDGPLRVGDVWLDDSNDGVKAPDGTEWHTLAVGGFRQGGSGLYALDITDTANPQFRWTYNTSGQSWSEPVFAKVKVKVGGSPVDRWVLFVGDGYDPAGVNGRMVHVIDLKTGKALWQYATASSVAASPMTVDMNSDGYVDRVYVGTVGGDVIRLDVSAVGEAAGGANVDPATGVQVANWSGQAFFTAGAAQPFYTKMAATVDAAGKLWLFIGSGDRSDPLLVPPTNNRIYGIKDPYPGSSLPTGTEADLTNMTNNNTLDASTVAGAGWYIVLRPGEKEFAEASLVFNQQVFFTTFMPGNTLCGDVGSGSVYMVYYLTGGGVSDTALFQADPPQASSRVTSMNAGVTTRPVLTTGVQGSNAVVYLGNSNNVVVNPNFSTPSTIRSTRYWRRVLP